MLSRLLCFFFLSALVFADPEKVEQPFSADVNKMMRIIVDSLYQNRNIFLRELISNSNDALVKWRTQALQSGEVPSTELPLDIRIIANKDARALTITDTGIGMTKEELIANLGSLGTSGTKNFLEGLKEAQSNLIGQFGVGFYSVFLAGDNVKVSSKSDASPDQWVWESTADGTFSVYKDPRGNTLKRGTEITIELKPDADTFLETDEIKKIVKQYSEFIDFPIYVQITKTEKVDKKKEEATEEEKPEGEEGEEKEEGEGEGEEKKEEAEQEEVTTNEWSLINEQKPIWTRPASEITKEEYNSFYKAITKEYDEPLYYSHFTAEGEVEFKSILYIPGRAPHNLFDQSSATMSNIKLYVRRVFITDEFKDLLPRYLNFIRGVVDSDDLPLNVSREILQENRLLKIIKKKLVRKALQMFKDIADEDEEDEKKDDDEDKEEKEEKEEKEAKEKKEKKEGEEGEDKDEDEEKKEEKKEKKFPKFWEQFGKNIRLGLIEDNSNRARLTKLLRYKTSKSEGNYTSLEDYVEGMAEGQKGIFFLVGESLDKIQHSPLLEQAKAEGIEVLYMTDAIDEYVVGHMTEFSGHKLVNLAKGENIKFKEETEKDKKVEELRSKAWEPFTKWVKDVLGDKIEKVVISKRVTNTPCVIVATQYGVSGYMEQIMKSQALADNSQGGQKARRVMEINHRHPIVDELRRRQKDNAEDPIAKDTVFLLYDIASLQSGFELADSQDFAKRLHRMMNTGLNLDTEAPLVPEEEYDVEEEEEEEDGDEEGDEEDDEKDEKEEPKQKEAREEL